MKHKSPRSGFSLLELLIVIGIISLLVQLMLPAVEAAREASRRTHCANTLKQLGTASLLHEVTHRRFPSGGWNVSWLPDPDEGNNESQPGGWTYNVLPFLEQGTLHANGRGLGDQEKQFALRELVETPLATFYCPSRRLARLYPSPAWGYLVAKTDYAANSGDFFAGFDPDGTAGPIPNAWFDNSHYNGIIYHRSQVRASDVLDGLSKTYLLGEKLLNPIVYRTCVDFGDDETLYVGADWDNCRWTRIFPSNDPYAPRQDSDVLPLDLEIPARFGSAHPSACNFALCDGSVKPIAYDIDPEVHRWMGNREDSTRRIRYYHSDGKLVIEYE